MSFHFFLEGDPPLPRSTPWEQTGLPSDMRQYLFLFSLSMQHSFAHSLMTDRSIVNGHVPMGHTCSFMCTGYIDMTALWEIVCSYDISHSSAWQASITSLAATSVSQMVTHLSTNWAQSCLTSVIGPWIIWVYDFSSKTLSLMWLFIYLNFLSN